MKSQGFPPDVFDGRPVIGICNTWSELTPCNAGLRDIAFDFYPGGRHEMLNEINRRQVQTRLLSWISQTLEKLSGDDRRVSTALELQH